MVEGLVRKIAVDFDVENIAKLAKASKDTKIAEAGADIELITKQSWSVVSSGKPINFSCYPTHAIKLRRTW